MGLTISDIPVQGNLHLSTKKKKKIKSTSEAMAIFEHVYWKEVKQGKITAIKIALETGTCSARQVIGRMIDEGTFVEGTPTQYWVSAVFAKNDDWEWTGLWTERQKKSQKTQGGWRPNKIWRLTQQAKERYGA